MPHRCHALLSQSGHFKERSSHAARSSREAGHGAEPLNCKYVARSPVPRRRACPTGGDAVFHRATSVRARPSGLITQHATSACRTGAVSLHAHTVHDPCSRKGDGPSIAQARTAWRDRRELFSRSNEINGLAEMYIHAKRPRFSRGRPLASRPHAACDSSRCASARISKDRSRALWSKICAVTINSSAPVRRTKPSSPLFTAAGEPTERTAL